MEHAFSSSSGPSASTRLDTDASRRITTDCSQASRWSISTAASNAQAPAARRPGCPAMHGRRSAKPRCTSEVLHVPMASGARSKIGQKNYAILNCVTKINLFQLPSEAGSKRRQQCYIAFRRALGATWEPPHRPCAFSPALTVSTPLNANANDLHS